MAEYPLIADPAAVRALLAGTRTQVRRLAASPLARCEPGDTLWVKEACVGGRVPEGGTVEMATAMRNAQYVVLADGWRQFRDGAGRPGKIPTSRKLVWLPAIHMPRWASRLTLEVQSVRIERLRDIRRADMIAEGLVPVLGGLAWRWPGPVRGLWRDPRRAFAAAWDVGHATSGERWEDNPEVVVLEVRRAGQRQPPGTAASQKR